MKTAVVIGAGWAGLSCAVELADKGYRVTLLEQSKRLGGRASSFKDEKTGDVIDNGQHLFMGCYTSTIDYLKKIGSLPQLMFQKDLSVDFADKTAQIFTLKCGSWPAPLHLASGLWGLKSLTLSDKLAMFKVYRAIQSPSSGHFNRNSPKGKTVEQWLMSLGQSERARRNFWDLITIATLNEQSSVAEAEPLAVVLKEAFFSDIEKSQIGISSVGLSDLCGPKAEDYLKSRGGSVRLNTLASKIVMDGDSVREIQLRDGAALKADLYVSAMPFHTLRNVLDPAERDGAFFAPMKNLTNAPIFSVTLWFDRPITDRQFVGLLDTETQWVFNKNKIYAGSSGRKDGSVTCVISGAQKFLETSNEDLLKLCLSELNACFPESRNATLTHSLIQREKNATLSPKVGYSKHRLPQRTPWRNLFLCGDWTDTGLPATIESAVRSGVLAAEAADSAEAAEASAETAAQTPETASNFIK